MDNFIFWYLFGGFYFILLFIKLVGESFETLSITEYEGVKGNQDRILCILSMTIVWPILLFAFIFGFLRVEIKDKIQRYKKKKAERDKYKPIKLKDFLE